MLNQKLLQPGYAGYLTDEELTFITKALKRDGRLRSKWGFSKGNRRLSKAKIRDVALEGVEALQKCHFWRPKAASHA